MADYYPLISRAVTGLEKNNGENRRALYERARAALLTQLRGITPPLDESDITRERLALEESIRKVEAEAARKFTEQRQPAAPKIRPVEPHGRGQASTSAPPRRTANPPMPSSPVPRTNLRPEPRQVPRENSDIGSRIDTKLESRSEMRSELRREAPVEPRSVRAPTRQDGAPAMPAVWPPKKAAVADPSRPESPIERLAPVQAPDVSVRGAVARHPLRRPIAKPEPVLDDEAKGAVGGLETEDRDGESTVSWPATEMERGQRSQQSAVKDRSELRMFVPPVPQEHALDHDFNEPMLEPSFGVDDDAVDARSHKTASNEEADFEQPDVPRRIWQLRPSPRLTKGFAVALIAGGVIGSVAWQWPNLVGAYRSFRAPAVETASDVPPATTRPKIADRIEPGSQSTPLTPQTAAAVAQKVVLYEEDPADPNGRRFVGSAIWRTETVMPGPGQPPELAIRADVEVPERKLAMTWSLRRNTDKGLPASHTVEIMFKLPTDFPSGGISNVPGILMKQAEQTRGVPLAGLAVKVTNGFFLIGLSSVDADKERNVQLLKERAWLDIPVVYNNNRRAILALEKGTPGERVFAEAFKVWKQ